MHNIQDKKREQRPGIDQYLEYYAYIEGLCRQGQYNLLLHRHLGDSFVLLGLYQDFLKKYKRPLHILIQQNQEVLVKLYGIENYTVIDFQKLMDEPGINNEFTNYEIDQFKNDLCERIFPSIPQLDRPFIAAPSSWVKKNLGWKNFVDGWAKMLGLEKEFLVPPECRLRLSGKMKEKLEKLAPLNKIVLLAPEAQSFQGIKKEFWENLAKRLKRKGFVVVTNAVEDANRIRGTVNLRMSVSDLLALGYACHSVYALRSGLCDCLVGRQRHLYVYYTSDMWFEYLSLNACFKIEHPVNEFRISTVETAVKSRKKITLDNMKKTLKKKRKLAAYISPKKEKMIDPARISVVVQGAVIAQDTKKCLRSIRKFLPGAEIILSTWQGADIRGLTFDKIILNKDPGAGYFDIAGKVYNNVNRQIVSTQAGIRLAEREFILKFRTDFILESDEFLKYWDSYPRRNRQYMYFKHRVLTDVLFSRFASDETGRPTPFHISDFWMFGYAQDIRNYFLDIPLLKDEELGGYKFSRPDQLPYCNMTFRYAPEQYFAVSFVKKYCPKLQFEDWTDFSEENVKLSENFMVHNFIFLSFEQSGIWSEKHANVILNENLCYGMMNHYYFQSLYHDFCDPCYTKAKIYTFDDNVLFHTVYGQMLKIAGIVRPVLGFFIDFLHLLLNILKILAQLGMKLSDIRIVVRKR